MRRRFSALVAIGVALLPAAGFAQAAPQTPPVDAPANAPADGGSAAYDLDVDAAIAHEREKFSVHEAPATCPGSDNGEIVVCVHRYTPDQHVPSSIDNNPRSREALHDGALHAPNVGSLPDCADPAVRCRRIGHAPPPIYYIDLSKIPMPPPGSDADRIAKGEMRAP